MPIDLIAYIRITPVRKGGALKSTLLSVAGKMIIIPFKICLPINAWFGNFNYQTVSYPDKLLGFAKLMELILVRSIRIGEAPASRNQGD
jgi:hypothetical protein